MAAHRRLVTGRDMVFENVKDEAKLRLERVLTELPVGNGQCVGHVGNPEFLLMEMLETARGIGCRRDRNCASDGKRGQPNKHSADEAIFLSVARSKSERYW